MDTDKVKKNDWHIKEIPTLLTELSTNEKGLSQAEAAKRLVYVVKRICTKSCI